MSTVPARTAQDLTADVAGGIGHSPQRPDGVLKVRGEFAYSSDLWADDMLWGATLRSPHPSARIRGVDTSAALALPGVYAVLTHADIPGPSKHFGLVVSDQPVLAIDEVRYQGEAVAVVAADHPETARRAVAAIRVDYAVREPVTDAAAARADDAPRVHPDGNIVRYARIRRGDPAPTADVVVRGEYAIGMQDQAFLGPESGLAVPAADGGVDLYVATQWLHADQRQIAPCLGLPQDKVRLTLAGVGGAFGAREDLSMQIHACLLALRTGRPVKFVYSREESFFGHVHRHPATLSYETGATRDGKLVYVKGSVVLDGGAYASSTPAVVGNATSLGAGPYEVPNVHMDVWGMYTNNPPCGAMRGFGSVQAAFGYESQLDRLAAALGLDPVELRLRNALHQGSTMPTGQVVDSAAAVREILTAVRDMPVPPTDPGTDPLGLPGGAGNTTHGEGVRRGIGYAVGFKNVGFSEGFDDHSTARVRLGVVGGEPVAVVRTAAVEVGQGHVTVQQQIARTELGVDRVVIPPADTSMGNAGSSSASRQTYLTGGAVRAACRAVRDRVLDRARARTGVRDGLDLAGGNVVDAGGAVLVPLAELLADGEIDETAVYRPRRTAPMDPDTGRQDFAHLQFAFCAHRAVVDVDTELGLVRVVELAAAQDVGKAVNPGALVGQIHGGSVQGMGLALMEEIQVEGGIVRNPSFTDYLIPTILDTPPMPVEVLELADPHAPYGLRGVAEPPTISAAPAVVAAIRAATGRPLTRIPVRPQDITG
ncbi:xanthine dehydrogenase subunit D [Actinocatenispora rupis]|uniref:Carbon-monoxide dehydrogenase large subunit n=1 Tax=Actinocatenispora rupis TaxID=519421 RepID=A0A8J3IYL3_9ACTN|nr:xanthine dehydrogenase subunit D [Actinocatenispora rupis]GID11033.1 carbon-monoxide dehydrogenase large subunit [Actinocatenispora rupis]